MSYAATLRIARKELGLFFSSPIAYLFLAAFLGATLFAFFWGEAFFARNIADVRPMFESLPVLLVFLASALTMRVWSDERRTGTLELVVTVPAGSADFVIGKFLACAVLLVIALILTAPLPLTVALLGDLDWGPVVAGYVAAALLGSAYLGIGLFVSAKTDNQIVSLIVSVFACGAFYLIGSPVLTELASNPVADALRAIGAGSRFESITRGVLDLRDLYFYLSVLGVFLALGVYAVDSQGWAADGNARRHRERRLALGLLAANFLIANVWLSAIGVLRWDMTEGDQYSIADATRSYLRELHEPLLLRGYFSSKTHPLLAPLVPQMQSLLQEYAVAGGANVRVEFVDPADDPELEDEANTKYGIRPVPFQVRDRYQASLVNSYFDVLVQYGDEYAVLGFRDLIEVKVRGEADLEVALKNPEYDLTRGIKKVLYAFQSGGSVFDSLTGDVVFNGYISGDAQLPAALRALRGDLGDVLAELAEESNGRMTVNIADPQAGGGALAEQIATDYGFQPMAASMFDTTTFYFYLTLTDGETVVQMPIPESLDRDGLRRGIEEGLKRFADGLLKTVAISAPGPAPQYMPGQPPGTTFQGLRELLGADFDIEMAQLAEGAAPPAADVLLVLDPSALGDTELFAIDQFLMRGGTVVLAAGAYRTTATAEALTATPADTGLDDWLAHHGVTVADALVMDPQNAAFPLPVIREVGGFRFQDMQMRDYPYFIDVREDGLNQDVPFTAALRQLTMTWASPLDIDAEANAGRAVSTLIESSPESWRSTNTDIMPNLGDDGDVVYLPQGDIGANTLAVMLQGRFDSFFDASPLAASPDDTEPPELVGGDADVALGQVTSLIDRSPESARLIVIGSASFLADQTVRTIGAADGTIYTGSLEFAANIADWAVEDEALLGIRSRSHFNRTLVPMPQDEQRLWEYANYAFAALGLVLVFGISIRRRRSRDRVFAACIGAPPTKPATASPGVSR